MDRHESNHCMEPVWKGIGVNALLPGSVRGNSLRAVAMATLFIPSV